MIFIELVNDMIINADAIQTLETERGRKGKGKLVITLTDGSCLYIKDSYNNISSEYQRIFDDLKHREMIL